MRRGAPMGALRNGLLMEEKTSTVLPSGWSECDTLVMGGFNATARFDKVKIVHHMILLPFF